jgi:3-oxoacyl-[acyl-carrier protein] reductase
MLLDLNLKERTVLITGGTRGIGAAIADIFAQAGANVIITGTSNESLQKKVADLKTKATGSVSGWVADLKKQESLDETCERIRSLNGLDVLVNNAGINRIHPIDEISTEDLDEISALNLRAPTILTRTAAPLMKQQRYGRILNIASIWSVITKPGRAMYTSSKFGLIGLTKASAVDLAPYNILVNALSPGFTMTDLTRSTLSEEEQKKIAQQVPMKRFAETVEMARVALFLCSDMNTYITGQNIVVDGGFVNV